VRISCPYCGERDLREFSYRGDATALSRPDPDALPELWDEYLHLRINPAGQTRDLWYHGPCATWLVVTRNTVTHEVEATVAAAEAKR
jgi:heterotetrameric sarcosine oxidase delta subunit